jgi:hypothetical protein
MPTQRPAWNKGRLLGQKPPLKPKEIWSLRISLQLAGKQRDLAMFNLAIDSAAAGMLVIEYGGELDVEHAIISQPDDPQMQRLLDHLRAERSGEKINDNLRAALGMGPDEITSPFAMWDLIAAYEEAGIRAIAADVCVQRKWLKDQRIARGAGSIAWDVAQGQPGSPLAAKAAKWARFMTKSVPCRPEFNPPELRMFFLSTFLGRPAPAAIRTWRPGPASSAVPWC